MNSVGIDLHRKRSHIAALDETGAQLLSRRIVNDPQTFLTLLEDVGECRIALEARDRLAIEPFGGIAVAEQRARTRLDTQPPVAAAGAGGA